MFTPAKPNGSKYCGWSVQRGPEGKVQRRRGVRKRMRLELFHTRSAPLHCVSQNRSQHRTTPRERRLLLYYCTTVRLYLEDGVALFGNGLQVIHTTVDGSAQTSIVGLFRGEGSGRTDQQNERSSKLHGDKRPSFSQKVRERAAQPPQPRSSSRQPSGAKENDIAWVADAGVSRSFLFKEHPVRCIVL